MEDKKQAIIPVFDGKRKGIAIDAYYCDVKKGNLSKINYPNFKYIGEQDIHNKDTNEERKSVHFIEIVNLPDNLVKEVANTINYLLDDKSKTIADTIDEIFNYFKKVKFKKDIRSQLFGDIGEAIFILKCFEQKINMMKCLRRNDNDLYDFKTNDRFIEVKSTSTEKNDFKISHEQLTQAKYKDIVIVKFKTVQNEASILDLYEKINKHEILCDLLVEKKRFWEWINSSVEKDELNDIIDDYTVILDNCHLSVFKKENLPEVNVINQNACKKIEYTINCTESELEDIQQLYNSLTTNHNK